MTVIEGLHNEADARAQFPAFRRDTITLTFEDRRKAHGKRRSDGGVEFAISLPIGTVLKAGDCMVLLEEQLVVKVVEAPEAVYVVKPKTPQEWAYYAYHVGNRHQQVMIGENELIFLQSPAVRSLLEQLRIPFNTDTRPFTAALANVGHSY